MSEIQYIYLFLFISILVVIYILFKLVSEYKIKFANRPLILFDEEQDKISDKYE